MTSHLAALVLGLLLLTSITTAAQGRSPSSNETATTGEVTLTASSANVSQPGDLVRIDIFRWSTDAERRPIVDALNAPSAPSTTPPTANSSTPGAASGATTGGDGAARGGRGAAGRGGRGGRGRGGAPVPLSPIAALTAAIGKAPTVGYIWTNAVTGYSIKYAYHTPLPDGGERIILATDRRLGAYMPAWTMITPAPSDSGSSAKTGLADYEFTLIELRMDSKGSGEGKTSLATKVTVDSDTGTLALDDYANASVNLKNVHR